jgi:hypothetical protein
MTTKYLSGFCSVGQCEGTKPQGWNGTPLKTCWLIETCSCECHAKLDEMFKMTGQPRILVDVSGYKAPERTWWMPSDEPDFTMDAAPEISTEGVVLPEKPVAVTATGRTSRGGLESWVQRECLAWLVDKDPEYGLPVRIISEEIGRIEGINPPSQGAIAAVFDRWVKYDYARFEDKPRRFVGLTELGAEKGLDWCRANFKAQQKKSA